MEDEPNPLQGTLWASDGVMQAERIGGDFQKVWTWAEGSGSQARIRQGRPGHFGVGGRRALLQPRRPL